MSVIPMRVRPKPRATAIRKARRVYAIAFDLDGAIAEKHCGPNWRGNGVQARGPCPSLG
jgi:hypothetical protein